MNCVIVRAGSHLDVHFYNHIFRWHVSLIDLSLCIGRNLVFLFSVLYSHGREENNYEVVCKVFKKMGFYFLVVHWLNPELPLQGERIPASGWETGIP